MAYLNIDEFFAGIIGEATDLDLPGLGIVRVRSLETIEVQHIRQAVGDDELELSFQAILTGMVEPKLTQEHLVMLQKAKPGVIAAITRRIMELSGMVDDSEKKVGNGS